MSPYFWIFEVVCISFWFVFTSFKDLCHCFTLSWFGYEPLILKLHNLYFLIYIILFLKHNLGHHSNCYIFWNATKLINLDKRKLSCDSNSSEIVDKTKLIHLFTWERSQSVRWLMISIIMSVVMVVTVNIDTCCMTNSISGHHLDNNGKYFWHTSMVFSPVDCCRFTLFCCNFSSLLVQNTKQFQPNLTQVCWNGWDTYVEQILLKLLNIVAKYIKTEYRMGTRVWFMYKCLSIF